METVISFYNCCPADTGAFFTVSASGHSLYRVDQARLRGAVDLILSVWNPVFRQVKLAVRGVRQTFRNVLTGGRKLIHMVCSMRF